MIVLRKKRILLVLSCIMVSLCVGVAIMPNLNKQKTVETVSLPVSNKVIVLDAGHGQPDRRSC